MNKIMVTTGLTIASVLALGGVDEASTESIKVKYTTESLNFRKEPSINGNLIGAMAKGSKVEVISEANGWAKIIFASKTGYCSAKYISEKAPTTKTITKYTIDKLNFRKEPSINGNLIGAMAKGSKVEVISESNGWAKIIFAGKTGYCSVKYISEKAPTTKTITKYTIDKLNFRKEPSINGNLIGAMAKGSKVEVISESNSWAKIIFAGKTGYCSAKYISEKSPTTKAENTTESNLGDKNTTPFNNVVATFSTSYKNGNGRSENIEIAASRVNGVILKPQALFDFNYFAKDYSIENGYKYATTLSNGLYSEGVGGGVCQVSTALFNAILKSGIIPEHAKPHSRAVGYVSHGLDAMVSDYNTFQFRNPYTESLKIVADVIKGKAENTLVVKILSNNPLLDGKTYEPYSIKIGDKKFVTKVKVTKNNKIIEDKTIRTVTYIR